jgi:hypothetical protein
VIDAICSTAGVWTLVACTTTCAQPSTLVVPDVAVAQTATPGEAETPSTVPDDETVAAAELLLHVTVGVMPGPALIAATSVTDWPTEMVAEAGATVTLVIGLTACAGGTVTLSPHAAAMIAVAATREERRTLMNNPLEVKNDCTIPRNMWTTQRIGNPL